MTTESSPAVLLWISKNFLTARRLRAQAIVLALCLWGVCTFDFSSPGLFDRAGNIKFQDFLPVYIAARQIAQHQAAGLYDPNAQREEMRRIVGRRTRVEIPNLYAPQVDFCFVLLARLSFLQAAWLSTLLSLALYFACVYAVWKCCPLLCAGGGHLDSRQQASHESSTDSSGPADPPNRLPLVALAALAYPPLFHFFVRGQMSAALMASFALAFLAMRAGRPFLAGLILGLLAIKPQFLVAIPLILLLGGSFNIFAGMILSAGAQFILARLYFGAAVMQSYLDFFLHPSRWINLAELSLAPIQMHSLRAFWSLLIPAPIVAFALYALTSILVIALTIRIWKSSLPLAVRFSALTFAAALVSPHLFIHDLLVLAPALLLLADWSLTRAPDAITSRMNLALYLAFALPLLGPLSRWTHLQPSVIAFLAVLWILSGESLADSEKKSFAGGAALSALQ